MKRDEINLEALTTADPYLLTTTLAHLTGDLTLVDQAWDASQKVDRSVEDFPQGTRAEAISRMSAFLRSANKPVAVTQDVLAKLVQFCAGEAVPTEYLPMLLEESGIVTRELDKAGPVAVEHGDASLPEVAIIGAGLSGIATAIYLKKAGIPFTLYEKNDSVGGTWYDNRYPGAQVDTASHFYAYSFAINPAWPRFFAKQGEVLAYIHRCVEQFGLKEHIRFGCTIDRAAWDDNALRWRCRVTPAEGTPFEITPSVLVSAVGQLNVPAIPSIPGLDRFEGKVVHTARWTPDADYRGKRVALIGTGASGVQVGPTMACEAKRLFVFQRSAQWLSHRPNYHLPVPEDQLWLFGNVPFFANWHRLQIIWQFGDRLYPALLKDENGEVSAANVKLRQQWTEYIERKLASRPDLLAKAMPDYPPLAKRVPVDFGWFDMLLRDNVELVRTAIDRVESGAIVTRDGERREVDLIVLATGFQATRMLHTIDICGRGGRNLRDLWGEDDPRAYLGITVPGFPNFFIMYGPNTNLGHGGSLIFQGECQARYIAQAVRHLAQSQAAAIEVDQRVFEAYNREVDEQLSRMVWGAPGVSNWFKNSKGRIVTNSPWRVVDYWQRTRTFSPADYRELSDCAMRQAG